MSQLTEARLRYFWRTKYPWVFAAYILFFSVLFGVLKPASYACSLKLNLLMIAIFTSFIFLFIFYIFGVRPIELEHHFR